MPRSAVMGWPRSAMPRNVTQPGSERSRWQPASVTRPSRTTSPSAGRRAGPGRPSPPNPVSRCPGCAGTRPVRPEHRLLVRVVEMARFLVTYHVGAMPSDPASVAYAREAFMRWAAKTGTALADTGEPVRSAFTVTREGARDRTVPAPFMGWSVIEAADSEAAAWVLQDHPFISPGAVLRISEPVLAARTCLRI